MQPPSDSSDRVAVWVFGRHPLPEWLIEPILWGLEEEGIPAETRPTGAVAAEAANAEELAKQAADGSPLNVGIGVSEAGRAVALHHRDLPASHALFVLGPTDLAPAPLRRLGANAARLVKGDPLAVGDETSMDSQDVARDLRRIEISPDLVERIATLAVARMVSEGRWRQRSINEMSRRRPA